MNQMAPAYMISMTMMLPNEARGRLLTGFR